MMAMCELTWIRLRTSVGREDALVLLNMFGEITGEPAEMWGTSIVGFGSYHFKYASGREGDWLLIGLRRERLDVVVYHDRLRALREFAGAIGQAQDRGVLACTSTSWRMWTWTC